MGKVVILGVFVADTAYRAERIPEMGETIMGNSFALGPGGKGSNQAVACARMGAATNIISTLGQDDFAKLALDTASLTLGMVVADVIPNPPETHLVRDARAAGCKVIDGLGMLVAQGVIGIEYWTGQTPDAGVMRAGLEAVFGA